MSDRAAVVAMAVLCATASLGGQLGSPKGGIDETGPYQVVEGWFKPLHEGTRQCVLGVFAETPDRIYVVAEVEVPAARPPGNCTSERSVPGSHSHFILVLNENGEVIEDWSQWNSLFGMPHAVKVSPYDPERHVWVINREAHQIHKFTRDGTRIAMTLGERNVPGVDGGHFNRPADIAFLPDGTFFVADGYDNSRVAKFDRDGRFLMDWGTEGSGRGQFRVPHGVTIDAQRRVYVADRDNMRIQIFREDGRYVDEWPDIRGIVFVMATSDQHIWALTGTTNRLLKYDLSGRLLTYWGTANIDPPGAGFSPASIPGTLYAPHAFSVDTAGNLYIADYRNHRVQKFVPKPSADRARLVGRPIGFK
jgi:DNA-binding beta-propeller fold protein YncE